MVPPFKLIQKPTTSYHLHCYNPGLSLSPELFQYPSKWSPCFHLYTSTKYVRLHLFFHSTSQRFTLISDLQILHMHFLISLSPYCSLISSNNSFLLFLEHIWHAFTFRPSPPISSSAWNLLPTDIHTAHLPLLFKSLLKCYCLRVAFSNYPILNCSHLPSPFYFSCSTSFPKNIV